MPLCLAPPPTLLQHPIDRYSQTRKRSSLDFFEPSRHPESLAGFHARTSPMRATRSTPAIPSDRKPATDSTLPPLSSALQPGVTPWLHHDRVWRRAARTHRPAITSKRRPAPTRQPLRIPLSAPTDARTSSTPASELPAKLTGLGPVLQYPSPLGSGPAPPATLGRSGLSCSPPLAAPPSLLPIAKTAVQAASPA
jgi:hypothetical protein